MNCTQTDNDAAHDDDTDDVANENDDDQQQLQLLSNLPASSMSAISWASTSGSNVPSHEQAP